MKIFKGFIIFCYVIAVIQSIQYLLWGDKGEMNLNVGCVFITGLITFICLIVKEVIDLLKK